MGSRQVARRSMLIVSEKVLALRFLSQPISFMLLCPLPWDKRLRISWYG